MELATCICFCLQVLEGSNKQPLKRKAFKDVSQVSLDKHFEQCCKRVGQEVAFDLKGFTHRTTSEAADVWTTTKQIQHTLRAMPQLGCFDIAMSCVLVGLFLLYT